MNRRELLRGAAVAGTWVLSPASAATPTGRQPFSRVRPNDAGWPAPDAWDALNRRVGGRLFAIEPPFAVCRSGDSAECATLMRNLKNPFFLGDAPGLTQTLGWVDAWTSRPSVYAVAAESTADIEAAVDFARAHDLRLVVKGGGHSYQGASNAPDSLLLWTRRMTEVTLHDAFVGVGCDGSVAPQAAVTIGAGALWGHVYDAVAVRSGRYVQGGGCLTVGVAGFVQGGGFGSLSKAYGTGAANLLEADVVTAAGKTLVANACVNPDLFWALRGGGGGTFGIISKVTMRTHPLPSFIGGVFMRVAATSDAAFAALVARVIDLYGEVLFNPHWGEQLIFERGNVLRVAMVFGDITREQAQAAWQPFIDWIAARSSDYATADPPRIMAVPARRFWDGELLRSIPGLVLPDDRPGAPASNFFWASNRDEAGQVLQGYQSAWLPAALLDGDRRPHLVSALVEASRHWRIALHVNKGLAGGRPEAIAATRQTCTNPDVVEAFALLICAAEGPPAHPDLPGHLPDVDLARRDAAAIDAAMAPIRRIVPEAGSYLSEGNYFDERWRSSFWGANYGRLSEIKDRLDPSGLFIVHHGVGSEGCSPDGFTRRAT